MNKLDQLIQSIDRLVELNEEILSEIRGNGLSTSSDSKKLKRPAIDREMLKRLINSNEVMAILNMSRSSLSRNIRDKIIFPIPIGKRNWFDLDQINALRNYFLK